MFTHRRSIVLMLCTWLAAGVQAQTSTNLSALALSAGTLAPSFEPATRDYLAAVGEAVDAVQVTAAPQDATAVMTLDGTVLASGTPSAPIPLAAGDTVLELLVEAPGSPPTTYTITMRRISSDADLSSLLISPGTLSPPFDPAVASYSTTLESRERSIRITPTTADPAATLRLNGVLVPSGVPSDLLPVPIGISEFQLRVRASDRRTTRTYRLNVERLAAVTDDVVLDLGAPGLWVYKEGAGVFEKISDVDVTELAVCDVDGDGRDDVVVDYGANRGIWIRYNEGEFVQINAQSTRGISVGDVDGNGLCDVAINFGAPGVFQYRNNADFVSINAGAAGDTIQADLDNTGGDDLVINFTGEGLWVFRDGLGFTKINPAEAGQMAVGDVDADGAEELVVEFPAHGVWIYRPPLQYRKINPNQVERLTTGNLAGGGAVDVVHDFGAAFGLWFYVDDQLYQQVNTGATTANAPCDLDEDGRDELVASFAGAGLWKWERGLWISLLQVAPEAIACGDLDGR